MQEKHEQLGEFGAIPGAPNGPPAVVPQASSLPEIRKETGRQDACGTLEIHDAARIFPPMSESEYAAFLEDIRVNEQQDPIWIYQGKVIDGRNRLRACKELGIEPKVREWDGNGSLIAFVLSRNLHRRHLNESQRAMVAAQLKPSFEAEAKQRMLAGKELDPTILRSEGETRVIAGKVLGISGASVDRASRVLNNGIPALVDAVSRGEIKVAIAAELARYSKEEQTKILAKGPSAIRAAASFWKRQEKERGKRKMPLETFLIGYNSVWREDHIYRMEVDHEYREELTSMLDESHDDNLVRALKRGLLIVMTKTDVA